MHSREKVKPGVQDNPEAGCVQSMSARVDSRWSLRAGFVAEVFEHENGWCKMVGREARVVRNASVF